MFESLILSVIIKRTLYAELLLHTVILHYQIFISTHTLVRVPNILRACTCTRVPLATRRGCCCLSNSFNQHIVTLFLFSTEYEFLMQQEGLFNVQAALLTVGECFTKQNRSIQGVLMNDCWHSCLAFFFFFCTALQE